MEKGRSFSLRVILYVSFMSGGKQEGKANPYIAFYYS